MTRRPRSLTCINPAQTRQQVADRPVLKAALLAFGDLMDSVPPRIYGTMISSIVLSYLANLEDPARDWQRLKEHLDKLVPRIIVTRDTP